MTMERFKVDTIHSPFFVGFDRMFRDMQLPTHLSENYPPHNIVHSSEDDYTIELAVAGFTVDDIDVTLQNNTLLIQSANSISDMQESDERKDNYIHKGIAGRQFQKAFRLSKDVNVVGGNLVNGILSIQLRHIIPEQEKKRTIEIGSFKDVSAGMLETEAKSKKGAIPKTK